MLIEIDVNKNLYFACDLALKLDKISKISKITLLHRHGFFISVVNVDIFLKFPFKYIFCQKVRHHRVFL